MRRYTRDEKLKAVQLYIQYGKSPAAVRYELGYPTKNCMYIWNKEYTRNNNSFPEDKVRHSKFSPEQRKAAVDYYLTHEKSIARTILTLGYPGKTTLCEWLNEDLAGSERKWFCKRNSCLVRCSQEQKDQAVIAYCSGEKPTKQISEEYGVLASEDYDHILSGVFCQYLSEKITPKIQMSANNPALIFITVLL